MFGTGMRLDFYIFNKYDPYRVIFPQIALIFIGLLILRLFFALTKCFKTFVLPIFIRRNLKKEYGKWAVITGCTQGIGLSYAEQLAQNGLNLVLIARNLSKLEEISQKIQVKHKIQVEFIVADFAQGPHIFKIIEDGLENKDIGILVNNVGVSYPYPLYFHELHSEDLLTLLNVNINSAVSMTQIILPRLKTKKKGAIINIGSCSGLAPFPLVTVYSATKAFLDFFSRDLS